MRPWQWSGISAGGMLWWSQRQRDWLSQDRRMAGSQNGALRRAPTLTQSSHPGKDECCCWSADITARPKLADSGQRDKIYQCVAGCGVRFVCGSAALRQGVLPSCRALSAAAPIKYNLRSQDNVHDENYQAIRARGSKGKPCCTKRNSIEWARQNKLSLLAIRRKWGRRPSDMEAHFLISAHKQSILASEHKNQGPSLGAIWEFGIWFFLFVLRKNRKIQSYIWASRTRIMEREPNSKQSLRSLTHYWEVLQQNLKKSQHST